MPKNISKAIDKFVENVIRRKIKKIILYGSYARGDYNSSSDIDIMILTDDEIEIYRNKISDIAYDLI